MGVAQVKKVRATAKRKKNKKRDYRKEYDNYHSSEKQKKDRAARNKSRADAVAKGTAKKGDGKDVDHKDRNPKNNSSKNKRVVKKSNNRSFSRKNEKGHGKRYA